MNEKLITELIEETDYEELSPNCKELAKLIGLENLIKLSKYLVNDRLYVPSVSNILMPARNKRIKKEYTGYNAKELGRTYGLSAVQINTIVKDKV